MNKKIEIPEGYEARIEGNKVIIELKESEDERIRKSLLAYIKGESKFLDTKKWIAYLEKQKEQPVSAEEVLTRAGLKPYKDGNQWCILAGDNIQEGISGFGDTIDEALYQFLTEVLEMQKEQKPDDQYVHGYYEGFSDSAKSYRPAEWSDEYREEGLRTRFAFYTYKDENGVLYLSNVFVEEASRNKGFGTKILQATEKVAETISATTIRLKVKRNSPANDWYRKRGYKYLTVEGEYNWLEKKTWNI